MNNENYLTILSRVNLFTLEQKIKLFCDLLDLSNKEIRFKVLKTLVSYDSFKELKQVLALSKLSKN